MKKRSKLLLGLVLSLSLTLGSAMSAMAATAPWTYDGVDETKAEDATHKFAADTAAGKYKLVGTAVLKTWVDKKEKMIVVDTMPAGSYNTANGHVPGAINVEVNMGDKGISAAQKTALLKAVESELPNKTVVKTTLKKVSKAKYKKLAKKNRTTKKVKGKKVYYKKVPTKVDVKDKSYKVVVYCGFVGCDRSHQGAAFLVSQGYTNVYRYGGGIRAWIDAGYDVEPASLNAK